MPISNKRNRRNDIAETAIAEFGARGFAGARVERIAAQAGVNKQLIFYYFGSKAGLYESVVSETREALAREWATSDGRAEPSTELFRTAFSSFIRSLLAQPHLIRLVLLDSSHTPLTTELARSVLQAGVSRLSTVISNGQGKGYFRDDADPDAYARHAVALAIGYLGAHQALAATTDTADEPEWIGSATELVMRGLAW